MEIQLHALESTLSYAMATSQTFYGLFYSCLILKSRRNCILQLLVNKNMLDQHFLVIL